MGIYDELQQTAGEVLAEFNQGVIEYGAVSSGAGPADEPGQSSIAWTTLTGAVMRGVQSRYVQAGLAVASDQQVTFAVQSGVTPAQKDFVRADGVRYKVEQVVNKPAAGTPVAHVLIIRK